VLYLSWSEIVSALTILLRFVFGVILASAVMRACDISLPINVIVVFSVGAVAAVWGDKFILGFMSLMRYLR